MVPIRISTSGVITKADINQEWYKYANKEWANAVLVKDPTKYSNGDTIAENDILMYFVWIPRYKYKLFNTNNQGVDPQQIDIVFENKTITKSTGSTNNTYLTHPAFTFGSTELNGIWVGKFETTGGAGSSSNTTNLTIKPGLSSYRDQTVSTYYNNARTIDTTYASSYHLNSNQIDTHMMKNMEWGAMTYLSHSVYGTCISGTCTEITHNSNSNYYTGGSNSTTSWASTNANQSTTLNRYGIYDANGGAWEYVMGNMTNSTTSATSANFYASSSEFTSAPEDKYIDYYLYDENSYTTHARGKLGDATREILKTFGAEKGSWFGGFSYFTSKVDSWFVRGGQQASDGVFVFSCNRGEASIYRSFRIVLTKQ